MVSGDHHVAGYKLCEVEMIRLLILALVLVGCKTRQLTPLGTVRLSDISFLETLDEPPCIPTPDNSTCANKHDEIWIAIRTPAGVEIKRYGYSLYEHGGYFRVSGARLEAVLKRMRFRR